MGSFIQIFQKGDVHTPQRFWSYALSTENKHGSLYDSLGFNFSEKHTKEYLNLPDDQKLKIRFDYINGIKQKY